MEHTFIASAAFGLEGVAASELRHMRLAVEKVLLPRETEGPEA